MRHWFTLNLGDPLLAGPVLGNIRRALANAATGSAFLRHESRGGLHCEAQVYFCPEGADLAEAFGARTCGKPEPAGLELLGGPPDAWRTHFPGSPQADAPEAAK